MDKVSGKLKIPIKFIPVVILVLVSFAVYFNALFGPFIAYDDQDQIVTNPWIRDIRNLPTIFSRSVWSFRSGVISNYYRPLMHTVYMLTYHLFGMKPWGFHLVNILFHCGVSVLVFLVIRRLLPEQRAPSPAYLSPPFIAAMLFASHPIHTEAITWIAGLPDVAFTFFYLLSFYLYIRSKVLLSGSFLFSVVCFGVAALFKEPALTLPALFLAYDYAFRQEPTPLSYYVKRYLPYLVIGAGYLALRIHALGGFAPVKAHAGLSACQYVINIFPLFFQYLEKLLIPLNLNAYYVFHPIASLFELNGFLSLIATAAFVGLLVFAIKKNRAAFLGFLFVAVPLLPVLYIPALGDNAFTDRYLYLPSVGYVLLLALFLSWAREKFPRAAGSITIAFIGIFGLYAVGTITRNNVWQNNVSLWSDTVRKSPDSAQAHTSLGNAYASQGQWDKAIGEFQTALRLKSDSTEFHNSLGFAYESHGQLDKAIGEFQMALRLDPDSAEFHNNLGTAYASQGRLDMAVAEFQTALRLKPDWAEVHNNLGFAYKLQGRLDEAVAEFQTALRLKPDWAEAEVHTNLGTAYTSQGRLDRAVAEFQTALRLKPDYTKAHYNLGLAYQLQGQLDGAAAEYQTTLKLKPDYHEARRRLNDIISRRH